MSITILYFGISCLILDLANDVLNLTLGEHASTFIGFIAPEFKPLQRGIYLLTYPPNHKVTKNFPELFVWQIRL
jgi:hypothetical protein